MASFEDLYAPWKQQARVGIKTGVGVVNTGIDITNLFRETDDHFKPIDMDRDLFQANITKAARAISTPEDPTRGLRATALLSELTKAPESSLDSFTEDAGVFMLGFLSGRSYLKGSVAGLSKGKELGTAGLIGVDLAAGAASAFTLEDPEADRLVNFIPKKHRPAFIEYLAYDPDGDETRLEGRFKNALVDMGLGVLSEAGFGLIGKTFKHMRRDIHLEAAGDPEVAARLAADRLGTAVPPPLPKAMPEVGLTSEAFETTLKASSDGTPPALPLKAYLTPESEAKAVKAIFDLNLEKTDSPVDAAFRALNHTHFDYRNPEASIKTANALLETMAPLMDNQGIQTWGDVLKASDNLAKKEALDSFESIAKITGKATADVEKAAPVTHLIRRMYVESGNELELFKTKFFQAPKASQDKMLEEFGGRLQTHMALTGGVSELGTAAGRLLRSFGMKAKGDLGAFGTESTKKLIREKGAKEGLKRGSRGARDVSGVDVGKDIQKKLDKLQKELETLRKRFGNDSALKKGKSRIPDSPEMKDLKDRIKFYKGAEADAKQITKLEGKLDALQKLAARGTKLDLEAGLGKLNPPKAPRPPEEVALRKQIQDVKSAMDKKLKALEGDSLEDRVAKALAENDAHSVGEAVKEATHDELKRLMEALKSVDMKDAKAWIKGQNQKSSKVMRVLDTLRKIKMMNILSGVPTFAVNNIGNTSSLAFKQGFEDIIASMVPSRAPDRMRMLGVLRGMRASVQQPVELFKHLGDATAQRFRDGVPLSETMAKLAVDDISRLQEERIAIDLLVQSGAPWAKVVNGYGKFAHALSFGHLSVTDAVFKQSLFASEVTGIANSKGILKGLKGRALIEFEQQAVSQAIFLARKGKEGARHMVADLRQKGMPIEDVVKHLEEISEMVVEGRKNAKSGVFQDEIGIMPLRQIESVLNSRTAGMHLLKTMVFPFYRTPVKIIEFATDRTPVLNLISDTIRADLGGTNGTRARQRAIAKMITGTTMYLGAWHLAQNNMITGKHSDEERASLLASNIPEYSVRIPNTDEWISYQRLDPFAIFLGITADMNRLVKSGEMTPEAAMGGMMSALTSNVLHKTFMKGLSDTINAMENGSSYGATYIDSQARAILSPLNAFQRSFEKVWNANAEEYRKQKPDPSLTELRGWVDVLLGDSGLTNTREYDMSDALGNKVERPSLWQSLTGIKMVETDDSPAMRELALHKRFPSNRELSLATGLKMTQDEFHKFKEILGKDVRVKDRLDRIVRSRKYRNASSEEQVKLLDKVIRDSRKLAKATLIRRDPTVRSAVMDFKKQRLQDSLKRAESSTGIPSIDRILDTRRVKIERL